MDPYGTVLDIRESTIGFSMSNDNTELVLVPMDNVSVLYTLKNGKDNLVEGNSIFIAQVLAKAGIKAVISELDAPRETLC